MSVVGSLEVESKSTLFALELDRQPQPANEEVKA